MMRTHRILTIALAAGLAVPAAAAAQDTRPGLAVLPFTNGGSYGDDAEVFDALQVGMQQMLMTELSMNPSARVVDRATINQILAEQDLARTGQIDPATAARIGRIVGARYVVAGSFIDFYGDMRMDARIVSVETSEIVNVAKVQDKREALYRLVVDLAESVMSDVRLPALADNVREERANREIPQEAVTLYSRALFYKDRGMTERARDLFSRVVEEFPQLTEAGEELRQLGNS